MDSKEQQAEALRHTVATSERVHADLYLGSREFSTVGAIVKAAFLAGWDAALRLPQPQERQHDTVHRILHEFQGTTCRTDGGWCDARDHADAIMAVVKK